MQARVCQRLMTSSTRARSRSVPARASASRRSDSNCAASSGACWVSAARIPGPVRCTAVAVAVGDDPSMSPPLALDDCATRVLAAPRLGSSADTAVHGDAVSARDAGSLQPVVSFDDRSRREAGAECQPFELLGRWSTTWGETLLPNATRVARVTGYAPESLQLNRVLPAGFEPAPPL